MGGFVDPGASAPTKKRVKRKTVAEVAPSFDIVVFTEDELTAMRTELSESCYEKIGKMISQQLSVAGVESTIDGYRIQIHSAEEEIKKYKDWYDEESNINRRLRTEKQEIVGQKKNLIKQIEDLQSSNNCPSCDGLRMELEAEQNARQYDREEFIRVESDRNLWSERWGADIRTYSQEIDRLERIIGMITGANCGGV